MKFSVSLLFFSYLFIYLFIYLFRAANFMHNINIIHRSFFPTALPHRLPFLFLALPFFALARFLALPNSLPCLFPWPAHAYFLLPMPYSYAYVLCLLPVSLPCLLLCPSCFLALPFSLPCLLPCLLPCPTYRSTFFMSAFCTGTFS